MLPMKVKVMRKPRLEIDEVEELPSYFRNGGHLTESMERRPRGAPADWRADYDYTDLNGDGIIDKQEYNFTMAKNLDRATRRWHKAKAVMKRSRAEQYATSRNRGPPVDVLVAQTAMDKAAAIKGGGTAIYRSTYGGARGCTWGGGDIHEGHILEKRRKHLLEEPRPRTPKEVRDYNTKFAATSFSELCAGKPIKRCDLQEGRSLSVLVQGSSQVQRNYYKKRGSSRHR